MLLWRRVKQDFQRSPELSTWLKSQANESFKSFTLLDGLSSLDPRRRIAMDPRRQVKSAFSAAFSLISYYIRIEALLSTGDSTVIAKFYHYMDELIMIRRSTASILKFNNDIEIPMISMMPSHDVRTVQLSYTPEEAVEAQWVHRLHAR